MHIRGSTVRTLPRGLRPAALAVILIALLGGWLYPPGVAAHGKEVKVTVISLAPDPDRPLVRLYRASILYASDLEPVEGARVELTAARQEGGPPTSPIWLTALKGEPGIYVGEVTYARFGAWRVRLHVSEPGEGETVFVDKVLPTVSNPGGDPQAEREERVRQLQLSFRFDWRDIGNILVRVTHSLAGVAYFAVTGAVLFLAWFGGTAFRPRWLAMLNRVFLPVGLTSLSAILASGLYLAAYGAPINPPGVYDLQGMQRLPLGFAYLSAFLVKPMILASLMVVVFRMAGCLRAGVLSVGGGAPGILLQKPPAALRLRRLGLVNLGLGLLALVDVVVTTYLHGLTHLGVFLS